MPRKNLDERRLYAREYAIRNREKKRLYDQEYRLLNKERLRNCAKEYRKKRWLENPWIKKHAGIISRCRNKNSYYYKNGIKNFLHIRDVKELWFRDRAYLLKEPSMDRIDTHGHYTKENCQFIELYENKIKDSRGEHHSQHKLTVAQVLEIRKSKLSDIKLGKQFGVSRVTIYDVRKRNSWKYV